MARGKAAEAGRRAGGGDVVGGQALGWVGEVAGGAGAERGGGGGGGGGGSREGGGGGGVGGGGGLEGQAVG